MSSSIFVYALEWRFCAAHGSLNIMPEGQLQSDKRAASGCMGETPPLVPSPTRAAAAASSLVVVVLDTWMSSFGPEQFFLGKCYYCRCFSRVFRCPSFYTFRQYYENSIPPWTLPIFREYMYYNKLCKFTTVDTPIEVAHTPTNYWVGGFPQISFNRA